MRLTKPLKIISCLLILLLLIGCVLFYLRLVWFVSPDRTLYPMRGIDVSHHQGSIDWNKVAQDDVAFAFIKATEADDVKDRLFTENTTRAQHAGIKTGAYHFYSLRYGGEIQANNFTGMIGSSSLQLPPVIDLEYVGNTKIRPSKVDFQKELQIFIDTVSEHTGSTPVLYTTYEFYDDYLYPEYKDSPIWIRDVLSKPNSDIKNWIFWQYNPRGRVDGIEGPVDLNVYRGTKEEFNTHQ